MTINSSVLHRVVGIFFVVELSGLSVVRCFFDIHEFDQRCIALLNVTNYLIHRPEQMNVDGLFGITLAEANLLRALNHPNAQFLASRYRSLMTNILIFLDRARLGMKDTVTLKNRQISLINAILNEPTLWIRPIFWKRGALGQRPTPTATLNRTIAEELIFRGSPQEKMLVRRDNPAGYPLTHRLLYVQIARAINCQDTRRIPLFKLIFAYCKEILQNLVDTEATGFPGVSKDLAVEQVLLCGMEGYMDFTNDHYAKLLRNWAHPAGCYNSRGFPNSQNNNLTASLIGLTRRSTGIMDFGCENHSTGLAAGTLALLVRENVENAYDPSYDYHEN